MLIPSDTSAGRTVGFGLAAASIVFLSCDRVVGPGEPAGIEIVAGDAQAGLVGEPLSTMLEVRVADDAGEPVSGVQVEWAVVSGGGSIESDAIATGDDGRVAARWTLGPDAGEHRVQASVTTLDATVVFVAMAIQELERERARSIASGRAHSCALSTDGTAYCWGRNHRGQLGDGTTSARAEPTPVAGDLKFASLSSGGDHTCGITPRAEAYCWGDNAYGALGDGSTGFSSVPVPVAGGVRFHVLGVGTTHACGLDLSGRAYCWGEGEDGELGTGNRLSQTQPTPVDTDIRFTTLDAGAVHTCALSEGGRAFCWGINQYGALGNGGFESDIATTPEPIDASLEFASLSAGRAHTCATSVAGGTYCWGLDDATHESNLRPVGPIGSVEFVAVSAGQGSDLNCGLTPAGEAYCWGMDDRGQLGDGDGAPESCGTNIPCSATPVAVTGGYAFAGLSAGAAHVCGITEDGRVLCWGDRGYGQIGDGSSRAVPWPRPVQGGLAFGSIAAGGGFTCSVDTGGAAYCWGVNAEGELGTGNTEPAGQPVAVAGSYEFELVRSGPGFSCGLTPDGTALCWGGYGRDVVQPTPLADARTLATIAVGGGSVTERVCGVTPDGETYCWDDPYAGTSARAFAAEPLVSLVAGSGFQCGLAADGTAYCWGRNLYGALGTGDRDDRLEPAPVAGGLSFDTLTAAAHHACGLTPGGTAYCWGDGEHGQLGDGATGYDHVRTAPHQVDTEAAFQFIVTGEEHTCALTDAGEAYCWGANPTGELGDGTFTDRATPVTVDTDLEFATLAVGSERPTGAHTCGLTPDGTAYCWGDGSDGRLGAENTGVASAPVPVLSDIEFRTRR